MRATPFPRLAQELRRADILARPVVPRPLDLRASPATQVAPGASSFFRQGVRIGETRPVRQSHRPPAVDARLRLTLA